MKSNLTFYYRYYKKVKPNLKQFFFLVFIIINNVIFYTLNIKQMVYNKNVIMVFHVAPSNQMLFYIYIFFLFSWKKHLKFNKFMFITSELYIRFSLYFIKKNQKTTCLFYYLFLYLNAFFLFIIFLLYLD